MYVGDDATDLDAFHALVSLADEGRISSSDPGRRRAPKTDRRRSPREADLVVDGTEGVAKLLAVLAAD